MTGQPVKPDRLAETRELGAAIDKIIAEARSAVDEWGLDFPSDDLSEAIAHLDSLMQR